MMGTPPNLKISAIHMRFREAGDEADAQSD